ncbi:MAG: MarR family transcriptional regulator [Actinobacteria bacterium]|nr:MarR family transcriptional regulator [Actinomycetota bacterium]
MNEEEKDQSVVEIEALLRNVSTIIRKRGRDILSDFDVTPPQFDALLALREGGELTMGELCQRMYLACSTATDLIDRMERNGLIARERDTADRRVIRLKITEKGQNVIEEVLRARKKYLSAVLVHVQPGERERLIQSLSELYSLMTKDVEIINR